MAIIVFCSFATFIITLDVMDYVLGFEAIEKERQKLRREKKRKKRQKESANILGTG